MKYNYIRSISIAILSSVFISFIIAIVSFTPAAEQLPNHSYPPFSGYVVAYLIFMTPAFIGGGFLSTWLMNIMTKCFSFFQNHSYVANLALHMIGAIFIAFIYLIILSGGFAFLDEIIFSKTFLIAISGGLFYFHLYMVSTKLFTKSSVDKFI